MQTTQQNVQRHLTKAKQYMRRGDYAYAFERATRAQQLAIANTVQAAQAARILHKLNKFAALVLTQCE